MKVVYKKSMIEQIASIHEEAKLSGKEIEKITLNRTEAGKLRAELQVCGMDSTVVKPTPYCGPFGMLDGVYLEIE